MTLLVCWVVFPLVLGVLSLGCGLLVRRGAGATIPGTLVPPLGLAAIVVVAQLLTVADATAELAAPAVVFLAVAGIGLSLPLSVRRRFALPAGAGLVVFAAFGAPVVLSGDATFAGYIKLDDTSTFLAITDHVLEHGRSLDGLAPSSYEAALEINLGHGYPVGALLPLGIGAALVGQDAAWVFQPYLAFLAALLALVLYELVPAVVGSARVRALAAVVAAQPALLFAYSLWGGIKELAAGAVLALVAALAAQLLESARAAVPLAVASAAALGILSLGGAVWLLPALAVAVARRAGSVAVAGGLMLVLSLPSLLAASAFLRQSNVDSFTNEDELGNLIEPLSPLQLLGVWPSGDFRLRPAELEATYVLITVVAAAGAGGLVWAWRRRSFGLLVYATTAAAGALVYGTLGSPWVDAKAFSTAAPAFLLAALVGCAALFARGRRFEALVATAAIAGGVVWSNLLAYREVNLAPRDQLSELEAIGERFRGAGPALMTEYQPYGVRHFLRELDPEGAAELRRRLVPLRSGALLGKGAYADLDELRLDGVLVYPTLVLRRSPATSRPPSSYKLAWRGRYYEVWRRPPGARSPIVEHLPLGDALRPAARPDCSELQRLGSLPQVSRLAAVPRELPLPVRDGTVIVRRPGRYQLWLGGSFRRRLELSVDGAALGTATHRLNAAGQYEPFGEVALPAGSHSVALSYGDARLRPGSAGPEYGFGPLVLGRAEDELRVMYVRPQEARRLCGQELDWLEALR